MLKKAKFIVETLHKSGYVAYYAGGWVRDFILGHPSDDIDIATSAPPEIVQGLFEKTIPLGIAFGIVLVVIDKYQYEVATFRKDIEYKDGRHPSSIEYSTALEDAKRRDFTINGMFFDPLKEEVIDYVDGIKDLEAKLIRAIGNPHERIKEDRLRMLRAVRLAVRLNFTIEEKTRQAIKAHATELFPSVAIERVWQELLKMDKSSFKVCLEQLFDLALLQEIFPSLKNKDSSFLESHIKHIPFFPKKAPTISKILDVIPSFSLQDKIDLCKYLKLSNEELSFIETYHRISSIIQGKKEPTDYTWAKALSSKNSEIIFQIIACHMPSQEKKELLNKLSMKKDELKNAIDRLANKTPIITASHLMACGILPSEAMGKLLKKAEEISINEKIEEETQILALLKKSSLWPKP